MVQYNTQLSNTAVPIFYGEFRKKVMSGDIPVCKEISLEMNRIDARISNRDIYYDPTKIIGFKAFCENEMVLTNGEPFHMLLPFAVWAEQLLCWFHYKKVKVWDANTNKFVMKMELVELINKQYLIVGRGAAKSMYISLLQAYMLIVNPYTTHQITVAPTMKQADEVMSVIRTAITVARGPVLKFLTTARSKNRRFDSLLVSTKRGIESLITASLLEIRPMRIDKLQGLRPFMSGIDEWLSGDIWEDVVGAVEQGASKLENYKIVAVSSEGTARNGPGDTVKMELLDILNGKYDDPHTSIFYYRLDDIEEVGKPEMWLKAQPNLGHTVSYESYHRDVLRAENVPSAKNDILAKRFGIPVEGYTHYFTYEETQKHMRKSYRDMYCSLGADMSRGDDFCSFTLLFPLRGGRFGLRSFNYISQRTYDRLPKAALSLYDKFIAEGSLFVMDGAVLDMTEIFYHLKETIEDSGYVVLTLGYDPYNAEVFVRLYKELYGSHAVEVIRQGVRTESVPLGELKKLAMDRDLVFDEDIMSYAMGNTVVAVDNNGNRKIYKTRHADKIDPVASAMDAYIAYIRNSHMFD